MQGMNRADIKPGIIEDEFNKMIEKIVNNEN
jgi:hypothetical protein